MAEPRAKGTMGSRPTAPLDSALRSYGPHTQGHFSIEAAHLKLCSCMQGLKGSAWQNPNRKEERAPTSKNPAQAGKATFPDRGSNRFAGSRCGMVWGKRGSYRDLNDTVRGKAHDPDTCRCHKQSFERLLMPGQLHEIGQGSCSQQEASSEWPGRLARCAQTCSSTASLKAWSYDTFLGCAAHCPRGIALHQRSLQVRCKCAAQHQLKQQPWASQSWGTAQWQQTARITASLLLGDEVPLLLLQLDLAATPVLLCRAIDTWRTFSQGSVA